jgi:hypothetical protein
LPRIVFWLGTTFYTTATAVTITGSAQVGVDK